MTYCKLGDRAIIIASGTGNEGKIVRIVEDLGEYPLGSLIVWEKLAYKVVIEGRNWGIESEGGLLTFKSGIFVSRRLIADRCLRPLPKLTEDVPSLEEVI